jgi:glycosyltransferase involved in cell wall biosynthesis
MMHLLSFTNCPLDPQTGSGKTVLTWSQGLRSLGHTVEVFQPTDFEASPNYHRGRQIRQALGALQLVNKKVQERHPDLIEFYGAEFWLATAELAKKKNRPFMVAHTNGLELLHWERANVYSPPDNALQSKLRKFVYQMTYERLAKLAFAKSDAFVALCEIDRRYVVDKGYYRQEMTHVIEPGLDEEYLNQPAPTNEGRQKRIAFTGSWTPRKAPDVLVNVMVRVLRRKADFSFDIFGAHADDRAINAFPKDLRGRVTVHPRLSNSQIATELSQCQIFLFPSEYEGFGMATAEAMSCGCPTVTTPTGFAAELKNGEETLCCDFGDVSAIEAAILRLIDDDDFRGRLAMNGWRRTRSLNWAQAVKNLSDVYENWVQLHKI